MDRAEFRRLQRLEGKKDKVYYLTQAQIDKMKEEAVQEAVDVSFALMLSVPANVLSRCYWEKTAPKRIPQFIDECLSVYESLGTGTLTVPELIKDTETLGKFKLECLRRIKEFRGQQCK